jgi:hypothetical protein
MDAIWTGPLADGATNFSLAINIPSLQLSTKDTSIGGPGRIPANFEFTASKALDGTPTGMNNDQTYMELVNQRNTQVIT